MSGGFHVPNPYGVTSGHGLYVNADGELEYQAPPTSDPGTADLLEELSQGRVAWIADGQWGSELPTQTSPVQDAIDAVDGVGGGGGAVYVPPGDIEEPGPLKRLSHKFLVGQTAGRGPYDSPEQHGSSITFTGGGDGIHIGTGGSGGFSDGNWVLLHGLTLNADDRTDGRAAIRFNGSQAVEDFNIGWINLNEWTNTLAQSNPGIISFVNRQPFRSQWQKLICKNTSGPGFYSSGGKPYGLQIQHMQNSPRDNSQVMVVENNVIMEAGTIMQGRWGRKWGTLNFTDEANLMIDLLLCEPSNDMSHDTEVVEMDGLGHINIREALIHNNGGYDQIFKIGGIDSGRSPGNYKLPRPVLRDLTTVDNSLVRVVDAPAEPIRYDGKGSEVTTTASATGNVIPIMDLTSSIGVA